ncbi:MAG: hypothetical protein JXR64_00630 [Spirochaetales bacterium]|nr:hypothetical protein [Spirochaetales bacterium]
MKKFTILFVFSILSFSLYSYQWPTSKDFLLSFFGTPKNNCLSDGIEFTSDNQAIYPLADGEIVYYQDELIFGDLDYRGDEGNILVLNHIGEFKSIYRNFTTNNLFNMSDNLKKEEMIGVSGNQNDNFIFSIYDDKRKSYINPQQILPFLQDERKPIIDSVYLDYEDSLHKLSYNLSVPAGASTIYVNTWDVVKINNNFKKFTPFSINVFVDGLELYTSSFSSLVEIDNKIFVSGASDTPVDTIISGGELLYGGNIFLTKGNSIIEIVVKDIDGNEASKSYSVLVNK